MRRGRRGSISLARQESLEKLEVLSNDELRQLAMDILMVQKNRALESNDPVILAHEFLERVGSEAAEPEVVGTSMIALPGHIQYGKSERHKCILYSVYIPGQEATWAWQTVSDATTLLHSESIRIGESRQSIAVHSAVQGMVVVQHRMNHDGERHKRISEMAWECYWGEDGTEPLQLIKARNYVAQSLPIPNSF